MLAHCSLTDMLEPASSADCEEKSAIQTVATFWMALFLARIELRSGKSPQRHKSAVHHD